VEFLKIEVNKKTIYLIMIIIILLSALLYNLLYINNKKNEIIEEIEFEEEVVEINEEEIKSIFVDVSGEVNFPGLYELPEKSRVNDAINIAGGITDKADLTDVNLAYILTDAMKLTIPKKEVKKTSVKSKSTILTTTISKLETQENINGGIININTASKEQLKTLDGIGDSTAQKIIDYRNEKGFFNSLEDIKNVSGIGDSKFEKIKDKIGV